MIDEKTGIIRRHTKVLWDRLWPIPENGIHGSRRPNLECYLGQPATHRRRNATFSRWFIPRTQPWRPPLNELWIAYPDDLRSDRSAAQCAAILDKADWTHSQRFKFARHRRESLTTRALVRNALSHRRALPPQDWQFRINQYGKPVIEPDCGLRFNASNSAGLVVCLVSELSDVGVDVEPFSRAETVLELAPEVFSAAERSQLQALPLEERLDRALSLWTLKESYIKARGLGLSIPLDGFSFLFEPHAGIRLEIDPELNDEPQRWRFFLLDHTSHRIAAVVERSSTENLQAFHARPAVASPMPLNEYSVNWFPRK